MEALTSDRGLASRVDCRLTSSSTFPSGVRTGEELSRSVHSERLQFSRGSVTSRSRSRSESSGSRPTLECTGDGDRSGETPARTSAANWSAASISSSRTAFRFPPPSFSGRKADALLSVLKPHLFTVKPTYSKATCGSGLDCPKSTKVTSTHQCSAETVPVAPLLPQPSG